MPNQQPNLEENTSQQLLGPHSKIIIAGKIIVWGVSIIFLIYHIFISSLLYLPIGLALIIGFFLLSKLLLERMRLKSVILNKETVYRYYFKNILLSFTIILFIVIVIFGFKFLQCLCIFEAKNIFTGECRTFTGSIPWYYREDESCEKQLEIKDETANWQTYRNEEYNYEIKYPRDWTTDCMGQNCNSTWGIWFSGPINEQNEQKSRPQIYIKVTDAQNNLTAKDYFKQQSFLNIISENDTTVDNKNGYAGIVEIGRGELGVSVEKFILIVNNPKLYQIEFIETQDENNLRWQQLFDQILSTFKFTK